MVRNHPLFSADPGKGMTQTKNEPYVLSEALWSLTADTHRHPIIVLKKDYLGDANDALGQKLLAELLEKLVQLKVSPQSIIFYHQAVKLTSENSPVLASLKSLQNKGSEILVCGTSADELAIEPAVGLKVRFGDLVDQMIKAEHVLWF